MEGERCTDLVRRGIAAEVYYFDKEKQYRPLLQLAGFTLGKHEYLYITAKVYMFKMKDIKKKTIR